MHWQLTFGISRYGQTVIYRTKMAEDKRTLLFRLGLAIRLVSNCAATKEQSRGSGE